MLPGFSLAPCGRTVDLNPRALKRPRYEGCHVALPVVIAWKNGSNLDGEADLAGGNRSETDRFDLLWTKSRRVRDREAPGSNPGPPTSFVFRIADFGRHPEP